MCRGLKVMDFYKKLVAIVLSCTVVGMAGGNVSFFAEEAIEMPADAVSQKNESNFSKYIKHGVEIGAGILGAVGCAAFVTKLYLMNREKDEQIEQLKIDIDGLHEQIMEFCAPKCKGKKLNGNDSVRCIFDMINRTQNIEKMRKEMTSLQVEKKRLENFQCFVRENLIEARELSKKMKNELNCSYRFFGINAKRYTQDGGIYVMYPSEMEVILYQLTFIIVQIFVYELNLEEDYSVNINDLFGNSATITKNDTIWWKWREENKEGEKSVSNYLNLLLNVGENKIIEDDLSDLKCLITALKEKIDIFFGFDKQVISDCLVGEIVNEKFCNILSDILNSTDIKINEFKNRIHSEYKFLQLMQLKKCGEGNI